MQQILIKCKVAVKGSAEGNALLCRPLSFLEGVNMETGEFNEESYHGLGKIKILQGKSH